MCTNKTQFMAGLSCRAFLLIAFAAIGHVLFHLTTCKKYFMQEATTDDHNINVKHLLSFIENCHMFSNLLYTQPL